MAMVSVNNELTDVCIAIATRILAMQNETWVDISYWLCKILHVAQHIKKSLRPI